MSRGEMESEIPGNSLSQGAEAGSCRAEGVCDKLQIVCAGSSLH